MKSRPLHIR